LLVAAQKRGFTDDGGFCHVRGEKRSKKIPGTWETKLGGTRLSRGLLGKRAKGIGLKLHSAGENKPCPRGGTPGQVLLHARGQRWGGDVMPRDHQSGSVKEGKRTVPKGV